MFLIHSSTQNKKVYTINVFTSVESFEFIVNVQCPAEGFSPSVVCVGPC